MGSVPPLLSFLLVIVSGWVHRHQLLVIEFLQAENRLLKERLRGKRIRFTDAACALLARKAKAVGCKALLERDTVVLRRSCRLSVRSTNTSSSSSTFSADRVTIIESPNALPRRVCSPRSPKIRLVVSERGAVESLAFINRQVDRVFATCPEPTIECSRAAHVHPPRQNDCSHQRASRILSRLARCVHVLGSRCGSLRRGQSVQGTDAAFSDLGQRPPEGDGQAAREDREGMGHTA